MLPRPALGRPVRAGMTSCGGEPHARYHLPPRSCVGRFKTIAAITIDGAQADARREISLAIVIKPPA